MASYEEAIETLFTDSGLGDELERADVVFGGEVDAELRALLTLVQRIDAQRKPIEIIDDPLMAEARERAAAILDLIPAEGSSTANVP
jgi:hypothetical protein